MSKKIIDLMDKKREIQRKAILPPEFWQAFQEGVYPPDLDDRISYHIGEFAKLIKGIGYAYSLYWYDYEINFIGVQDAFYISIYSITGKPKRLGIINYNTGQNKRELCYREKEMDAHPLVLPLLYKINDELNDKGLTFSERASKGTYLPFEQSVKMLICFTRWGQLMITEPDLLPQQRAETIALELNIDPVTAAGYGSRSPNDKGKTDAYRAFQILRERKYNINDRWLRLIEEDPDLCSEERADRIAAIIGIEAITVAGYGRAAADKRVRYEAAKAYNTKFMLKHNIDARWDALIEAEPDLDPQAQAHRIADEEGIDPISVASYGRISTNPRVKSRAIKAYNLLLELTHQVTQKWRDSNEKTPNLTPPQRAEIIAEEIGINPLTLAQYGKFSDDDEVRSESIKAYHVLMERYYKITERWNLLSESAPHFSPEQKAEQLARESGIDPVTLAGYGIHSEDEKVRTEANKAYFILKGRKRKITRRWQVSIKNRPNYAPLKRVNQIAAELKIKNTTVALYGSYSIDRRVRTEANKAYYILRHK